VGKSAARRGGAPALTGVIAWGWLDQKKFHKLGPVDATSFVVMRRRRCRIAFAFDIHFGVAGFRYVD
jgi:predicted nucleic acid-binding protein